jgi:Icc-related predicted phosphoesterase
VIRIAAVADLHFGLDSGGTLRPHLEHLTDRADVFLIGGDVTRSGKPEQAKVLAEELRGIGIPTIAVLGNHDYHAGRADEVVAVMEEAEIRVLEGTSATIDLDGARIGVAGIKGFGGGFVGACASDFGEDEMKAFIRHTVTLAERLESALSSLEDVSVKVALLHYSPIEGTLRGERLEIYPFLGSYLLGEAIDRAGADVVFHGHAHRGSEKGVTPGGVHVRNVALPVIRHAYSLYCLEAGKLDADADALACR